MRVIVESDVVSEEIFRSPGGHHAALKVFLESEAGMAFLFLIKQRAKARGAKEPVPFEAVPNFSISELARLKGMQEVIDLIEKLTTPSPVATKKDPTIPVLGSASEKDLPPTFKDRTTPK